ncbi:uncharacterized protein LOC131937625 [Physella acuta]|uniref:uncharacterized protein LOC131937625 n=1 Tax=Physella acuta TaxID=109671 RepID=UPI0027DC2B53|nr:uncharacterized protein LOC131937625 [Physella acuta]
MMLRLLTVLLGVSVLPTASHSPYQQLLYGSTANLTCRSHDFRPSHHVTERYQWMLPSNHLIDVNTIDDMNDDRYELWNNGSILLVKNIDKEDFGFYFCLVMLGEQKSVQRIVKLGINVDGPYFGDMWDKYSGNLKTGLISGGIVALVMAMFCYNYDQYQAKHDKPAVRQTTNNVHFPNSHSIGTDHINPVYIEDESLEMSPDVDLTTPSRLAADEVEVEVSPTQDEQKTSF